MSYLGLALVAEGPTDYRFLSPVLYRLTEDLCLSFGVTTIEVGPVTALELDQRVGLSRAAQIVEAARASSGSYHVLFLHTDGGGNHEAALRDRFEPWSRALEELERRDERAVAVVPVREMEAWALCDGDALREAFGSNLNDERLGLPRRAADIEGTRDPKQVLQRAYERVFRPRRPRRSVAATLEAIAERVRLEQLRLLPAFARLEEDLRGVLQELRYLES